MDKLVDYKEVPIGDEAVWQIEYEPVWANDEVNNILRIAGWKPKAAVYAPDGGAEVVYTDVNANYVVKIDEESAKPVEKRGLYDLYIDNHIDIPESISKESPCYKQFMKERERM